MSDGMLSHKDCNWRLSNPYAAMGRGVAFGLAALALGTGLAAAEGPAGIVRTITPMAERVQARGPMPLALGEVVDAGDRLRTDKTGQVSIAMADGSELTLGPSTEFDMAFYQYAGRATDGFAGRLLGGLFRFVTGALRPQSISFDTPTANLGVRGTDLLVSVGPQGATRVEVLDGVVVIRPLALQTTFTIGAGTGALIPTASSIPLIDRSAILSLDSGRDDRADEGDEDESDDAADGDEDDEDESDDGADDDESDDGADDGGDDEDESDDAADGDEDDEDESDDAADGDEDDEDESDDGADDGGDDEDESDDGADDGGGDEDESDDGADDGGGDEDESDDGADDDEGDDDESDDGSDGGDDEDESDDGVDDDEGDDDESDDGSDGDEDD